MKPILVIAEKPSVARDIAKVLGAHISNKTHFEGNGYQVSWALGHLVTLPQPHEINPEWKSWKLNTLPMIPNTWPLTIIDKTKSQFRIIKLLMKDCSEIVCATDAGREGELIFRYIYEAASCRKPVKRLWISSLTPEAIRNGFQILQPWDKYESLAAAARARSQADWLIGMNLSRAYAITSQEKLFVGRVQTPTLAMIVKRDLEIQNFKPEDYFEIVGKFFPENRSINHSDRTFEDNRIYEGFYIGEKGELHNGDTKNSYLPKKLPNNPILIDQLVHRIQLGKAKIASVEAKTEKLPPPFLYDLTELQRHANRIFGFSASKTLETAQSLYEKHKLISYPRTDSKYLSTDVAKTLPRIVSVIRGNYDQQLVLTTGTKMLGSRYINDIGVTDHHAIIPTDVSLERCRVSDTERKIYDLICRRLLMAWQEDFVTDVTTVITEVEARSSQENQMVYDIFRSQGRVVDQLGWKRLEIKSYEKSPSDEKVLPRGLAPGLPALVREVKSEQKKTKAPPHLTESALLMAMETAGRKLDDKDLAAAMRDSGLGTPATRAGIIETLLDRNYIERRGKSLVSTELGQCLVSTVHPSVKSPELTARWEKELGQIQQGKQSLNIFMNSLHQELKTRIQEVLASPTSLPRNQTKRSFSYSKVNTLKLSPEREKELASLLIGFLSIHGARPAGKLYEELQKKNKIIERKEFEFVLNALNISGGLQITQEQFQKNGQTISYRRVSLKNQRPVSI